MFLKVAKHLLHGWLHHFGQSRSQDTTTAAADRRLSRDSMFPYTVLFRLEGWRRLLKLRMTTEMMMMMMGMRDMMKTSGGGR